MDLLDSLPSETFSAQQKMFIKDYIGNDEKISAFMDDCVTNVVSLCKNTASPYMWEKYAMPNGYCIIFDRKRLVDSLYFKTAGKEQKNGKYIKHAPIIYETNEQFKVIQNEAESIMAAKNRDLCDADIIRFLLQHLMFVGHYYKAHSLSNKEGYENEEEYRILTNTYNGEQWIVTDSLPAHERNGTKRYIELFFDRKSICEIVCADQNALERIEGQIKGIKISVRSSINRVNAVET